LIKPFIKRPFTRRSGAVYVVGGDAGSRPITHLRTSPLP